MIDFLLGMAVLTGPLWFLVLWLVVTVFIAAKLSKRFKSSTPRLLAGIGIFVVAYLLPFADEIIGRAYFNYLCTHEAGVKVYQTVELPKEYWDERGNPKFLRPKTGLDMTLLADRVTERTTMEPRSSVLGLDRRRVQVVHKPTGQVVGEVVSYVRWGGWVHRNLNPAGRSGVGCERLHGVKFWFDFYSSLFTRSVTDN
jgi:hypothetical protein